MLNIPYDVSQIVISIAQCTSDENLQNSNVFLQLFGVQAPYIL